MRHAIKAGSGQRAIPKGSIQIPNLGFEKFLKVASRKLHRNERSHLGSAVVLHCHAGRIIKQHQQKNISTSPNLQVSHVLYSELQFVNYYMITTSLGYGFSVIF